MAQTDLSDLPAQRSWSLVHVGRPVLANEVRRMHWAAQASFVTEWRGAFAILARKARVPHLAAASLQVTHYVSRSGRLPDVGACAPSAKAACDGLVDAGVLVDDDPAHLVSVTYTVAQMPPEWKRPGVRSALGIVVTEVDPAIAAHVLKAEGQP